MDAFDNILQLVQEKLTDSEFQQLMGYMDSYARQVYREGYSEGFTNGKAQ